MVVGYSIFLPCIFSAEAWNMSAGALTRALNPIIRSRIGTGDYRIYPNGEIIFTKFTNLVDIEFMATIEVLFEDEKEKITNAIDEVNLLHNIIIDVHEEWTSYKCTVQDNINLPLFLKSFN